MLVQCRRDRSFKMEDQFCLEENHSISILNVLNDFRENKFLCDLVLVVQQKEMYCHRNILAAGSPYFRGMFSTKMKENMESKPVILNDLTVEIMELILAFLYTGQVLLTAENVKDIVAAANYFLMDNLKETCCQYLKKNLKPSNCLGVESIAEQFGCDELKEFTHQYILDNFVEVSQSKEFLSLCSEHVLELLSNDGTNVEKEEQIYEALLTWVKGSDKDQFERIKELENLLCMVRFPLMSPYYIADHVEKEEIVTSTSCCSSLLLEAKNYHLLPDRRHLLDNYRTRLRKSMGLVNVIIGAGGIEKGQVKHTTFCFLPHRNTWFYLTPMASARCRHGLAVMGEFVYAVGGQSREGSAQSSLNDVERYDPRTNTWAPVASMLKKRSLLNVAVLDGTMYAVGGCDENNVRQNTVEKYSPSTDTWTMICPMASTRSSACVVGCYGLYVIGGVNFYGMSLNSVEKYDPSTDTWSEVSSLSNKRASACGAFCNGKIYVIGGWDGTSHLNSGEVYSPDVDEWNLIPHANTARWDAGIAVDNNKVYIVGGCDRNALCTSETECFDSEKNEWSVVASLPFAIHGLKCSSIPVANKFFTK